jgi:hypothetical protein
MEDRHQELPQPQGHVLGFVDSQVDFEAVNNDLNAEGVPDSRIMLLHGEDGKALLKRMMAGSWGESAQVAVQQGLAEMNDGHYAICVEVADHAEAVKVANIASRHGGHSFDHFGVLIDTRITP